MELDFSITTLALTVGFYLFILFLIWGVPFGFTRLKEKVTITIVALPLVYLMVSWQVNK